MDEGRRDRIKKKDEESCRNISLVDKIKSMTRISSGKLACEGEFHIGKEIREKVVKMAEKQEADRKRVEDDAKARGEQQNRKHKEALEKLNNGSALTITDLKALISSKKRDGDSPLKTKRSELEDQWKRRQNRDINLNLNNVVPGLQHVQEHPV